MIVVTGSAGFIGSVVTGQLNAKGFHDLILVDDFKRADKTKNYNQKNYKQLIERDHFIDWLNKNHADVDWIIHLGARTDTTEFDRNIFEKLNVNYSKDIWKICSKFNIPLIYASSAATYGLGELGYVDDHDIVPQLKPLNPYGESKNEFDLWALQQSTHPPFWAGLKFFNVYGPNEFHKGRMASVVFHGFNQINNNGFVNLFKSHNSDYEDGMQLRDFVYVKDVAKVIAFLMDTKPENGLYNLGTGKARSFVDLATSTFEALNLEVDIRFIDTPTDIRNKYQYFTEANMDKLRKCGYNEAFTSIEDGVADYVKNYLISNTRF